MTQNTRSKVYTYSLRSLSDFKGKVLESHFEGMLLDFNNHELAVRFIGKFNAYNLLAVFGTAVLLGKKEEDVLVALSTLHPVTGRFDAIRSPKGYTAIVDYAHTPDALVNVLNAIHGVLEGKGKVITVVGAGGNRDKGKRPIMAKESARLSDRVIITSDNPRFEEPQDIINDMLAGLDKDDMQKTISITDRREAIKTACMLAQPGDVILVAGKGHENYKEIIGVKRHFDDKEIINEIRLERADIAWIGISIEGTNAIVKIVEAEAKPEIINEEDYSNIIATKDAQIVKIKEGYSNWQNADTSLYSDVPEFCRSVKLYDSDLTEEERQAKVPTIESKGYSLAPSKYIEFIDHDLEIDY